MQHDEIKNVTLEILQEADDGRFFSTYQVFERIKEKDPDLAKKIETAYSVEKGEPPVVAGSDEHYTIAVFIANTLIDFQKSYEKIKLE
ncbi:MAG: hypothetical protein ABSB79_01515 [Syntrophales bacterium]|jgi:hypothetical protein